MINIENIDASLRVGYQMHIPESVRFLQKQMLFWDPRHHEGSDTREHAIQKLMEITGASYETLDTQSWDEHNLLWKLHEVGNDAMAKRLAHNAREMTTNNDVRNMLLKTVIWRIHEKEHLQELTNVDPNVITYVRREIAKDKTAWEQQWLQEMRELGE
jgi:hypothetical protein